MAGLSHHASNCSRTQRSEGATAIPSHISNAIMYESLLDALAQQLQKVSNQVQRPSHKYLCTARVIVGDQGQQ